MKGKNWDYPFPLKSRIEYHAAAPDLWATLFESMRACERIAIFHATSVSEDLRMCVQHTLIYAHVWCGAGYSASTLVRVQSLVLVNPERFDEHN